MNIDDSYVIEHPALAEATGLLDFVVDVPEFISQHIHIYIQSKWYALAIICVFGSYDSYGATRRSWIRLDDWQFAWMDGIYLEDYLKEMNLTLSLVTYIAAKEGKGAQGGGCCLSWPPGC